MVHIIREIPGHNRNSALVILPQFLDPSLSTFQLLVEREVFDLGCVAVLTDSMPVHHTEVLIETQVSEMWPSVSICLVQCHVDTRSAHADCFRGLLVLAQRAGSVLNAFPFPENDPVECVQVHILPCLLAGKAVGIAKQVPTYLDRGQLPAGK